MKIAIIGCGAMGSVYAALLADSGNDVWAIDTWEEHISAIRSNGLRVEGASGQFLPYWEPPLRSSSTIKTVSYTHLTLPTNREV